MDTPLPSAPLIQKFDESRTRTALLRKLLSGELRVPAAAKLVEAVE
jgi:hypothetical protein